MNKTVILILGLSLAMTGFAQKSPKGRPSVRKSPESNPIVADDRDRASTSKSKPPKLDSPRPTSGPTIVKAKPRPSQLFTALDANKDGKLSLKEIEAAVTALKKLDKNKDDELTLNEFGPTPKLAKPNRSERSIRKSNALSSTLKARAKPSKQRPSRRPTVKPIGSPKAIAELTQKSPGTRPRPGARPRPSSKPGQKTEGTGTSTKAGDLASSNRASSAKRVARKAPARKVSKAARAVDPDIQTLIDETAAVTELIRKAAPKINNLAKKQSAQNWTRRGSRAFLRSLNNIQDQDKAVKLAEANQKLEEVRKLLE